MNEYKASPCVGSGLCCKTGPCGYGEWDTTKKQCAFLETHYKDEVQQVEIHKCGRYDYIKVQPGADMMPAFGAGCCMGMFNTARNNIIRLFNKGDIGVTQALERIL
jgi:hypothetical protein